MAGPRLLVAESCRAGHTYHSFRRSPRLGRSGRRGKALLSAQKRQQGRRFQARLSVQPRSHACFPWSVDTVLGGSVAAGRVQGLLAPPSPPEGRRRQACEAAALRRPLRVHRPARRLRVRRFRPRCFLGRTVTVIRGQHRRVRRSRVGSSLSGDLSGVPRSWSGLRHVGGKWVSRCLRLRSSRGRLDRRVALGADVFCSFRSVLTCRLRGLCAS